MSGLVLEPFFHNDGALSPMKLVANFLITQRGIEFFSCNRRWHTYSPNTGVGSGCMNDINQMPTDTAFLVSWVNENTSDYVTVESSSADDFFAQQGYENPAPGKLCGDDLRSKTALNLSDHIRRVVL